MGRSQPQHYIVANRRCRTHKPGTEIVYTGPRSAIPPGWNYAGRCLANQQILDIGGVA